MPPTWMQKRGDYEKMQVFVNTDLGLPWEEPGEAVEANNLLDRREFYEAEVPDGVVYLTAGDRYAGQPL